MSAIEAAVAWMLALLSGSLMTMLLTIAVAAFGFTLLTGRVSARRGIELILGCFILVGSVEIARSLVDFAQTEQAPGPAIAPQAPETHALPPLPPAPVAAGDPFDPYAGREQVH
ncbi:MAG: hypothetical protein KJZ64_08460 [Sphingomonadaceae bacterium]|nr:hypothetical protein [Sphingomonadaceae bacterium]